MESVQLSKYIFKITLTYSKGGESVILLAFIWFHIDFQIGGPTVKIIKFI